MRNIFVALGVFVLTLAGCGGQTDNSADTSSANKPATPNQTSQNRADGQASPESSRRVLGQDEMGESLVGEVSDWLPTWAGD